MEDMRHLHIRRKRGYDDDEPLRIEKRRRVPRTVVVGSFGWPRAYVDPPSVAESLPGVDARVKWFKQDKGYGFVEIEG